MQIDIEIFVNVFRYVIKLLFIAEIVTMICCIIYEFLFSNAALRLYINYNQQSALCTKVIRLECRVDLLLRLLLLKNIFHGLPPLGILRSRIKT